MSTLSSSVQSRIYSIKKWRGVNENPDGDTNLADGEAAVMRNFRISDGQALQIRPGSRNIANLLSLNHYEVSTGDETAILSELNTSSAVFETYPSCTMDSVGLPVLSGEAAELSFADSEDMAGRYFSYNGQTWQFTRAMLGTSGDAAGKRAVPGGFVSIGARQEEFEMGRFSVKTGDVSVLNGEAVFTRNVNGSYFDSSYGPVPSIHTLEYREDIIAENGARRTILRGYPVKYAADLVFTWYAKPVGNEYVEADSACRGLWSGYVGGSECICAACNGKLWSLALDEESGAWSKTEIGSISTAKRVCMFGYSMKLYVLDGSNYYCWDGTSFGPVEGYVPCVATATKPVEQSMSFTGDGTSTEFILPSENVAGIYRVTVDGETQSGYTYSADSHSVTLSSAPAAGASVKVIWQVSTAKGGGGTSYEQVNKLTAKRSQLFSATGDSITFKLNEENISAVYRVEIDGEVKTGGYTVDTAQGAVTFAEPPELGMNNVQIWWTAGESYRAQVTAMRYAELYNGATDNRVFIYGDGSNEAFYSGLDSNGSATAEYFPDLNEIAVGESNTPITAMIRHYNRLLVFKTDSAYSIYTQLMSLADGSTIPGFYLTPVNRSLGNEAPGQARLVENRPRTVDGRSIYEWKSTSSSGNITGDERNAGRVSQKVEDTLKSFRMKDALCFYDKIRHEYYCVYDGTAAVQNTENGAWYIYTEFPAAEMIVYKDELYYATADGWLRHFSRDYRGDNGQPIDALWESGALSFSRDYIRKYSLSLWVGIKPESGAAITVSAETEREKLAEKEVRAGTGTQQPRMERVKLKASKFTYYRIIFSSRSAETTATIVSTDVDVKLTSVVR